MKMSLDWRLPVLVVRYFFFFCIFIIGGLFWGLFWLCSVCTSGLCFFAFVAEERYRREEQRRDAEAWERDHPARELQRRLANEALERDRPARVQRQRLVDEALERDRPARVQRQRLADEALERDRTVRELRQRLAKEEREKWQRLQAPLGSICSSRSPIAPRDRRRQLGFFKCTDCHISWRSNECWEAVKQVCPKGCHCAVLAFKRTRLDHDDSGSVERGILYGGPDRSFGRYECACGRSWQSAHAWRGETQACQKCRGRVTPFWREVLRQDAGGDGLVADRRHDVIGCSKCLKLAPQVCYRLPAAR